LEALRPVSVVTRAWGWEAVVSAWDEDRPLAGLAGEAEVSALTLEEIFLVIAGVAGEGSR
jgi:hypothetical protein